MMTTIKNNGCPTVVKKSVFFVTVELPLRGRVLTIF